MRQIVTICLHIDPHIDPFGSVWRVLVWLKQWVSYFLGLSNAFGVVAGEKHQTFRVVVNPNSNYLVVNKDQRSCCGDIDVENYAAVVLCDPRRVCEPQVVQGAHIPPPG